MRLVLLSISAVTFLMTASPKAYAAGDAQNVALVMRGAMKTVSSVLQIPGCMLQDSARVIFPFGIVTGAIRGTVKAVAGTVSGAVDMASGAAPYAKYAAFI